MPVMDGPQAFKDLDYCLMELRFTGVSGQDCVPDGLQPCIHELFLTVGVIRNCRTEGGIVPNSLRFNLTNYDRALLGHPQNNALFSVL
ncbi:hypothetical protein GCM10018951_14540 [Pseudarthrobacter polychromogenes]